jgi:CheY-like chemotaxis protein
MSGILIVDDSSFMRSVIRSIVTQAGYKVVGEAENGLIGSQMYKELKPDAVTLDISMDEMDGLGALKEIITFDPKAVVILISAIAGQRWILEEAKSRGVKSVLLKPVDPNMLIATLKQFAGPPTNTAIKSGHQLAASAFEITPKLMEIFRRDAAKAAILIRVAVTNHDIKKFTTAVHSMKAALANIGENEKSELAARLEEAGIKADMDYIKANFEGFVLALEELAAKGAELDSQDDNNITEDTTFLKEQLQIIKQACENYNDTSAYVALNKLKEKQWRTKTKTKLEEIYDTLFLYSDFEQAAQLAQDMTK